MGLQNKKSIKRREFLAGMASVPLLGVSQDNPEKSSESGESIQGKTSEALGIGIIGYGKRGEELLTAMEPTGLNVEIRGISEIFDVRLERGLAMAGSNARACKNYLDLLKSDDIDAVIIATPDHWHARMAVDAAQRGKHIYLEMCMTHSAEEAKTLREAVKRNGVIFQLGHQGRQRDLNRKARELIANDTLGKITLIETTTNRNDPGDGWKTEIAESVSGNSIDWDLFQEAAADKHPFSAERYYGWRNYWAYGNGMSGDLLSNEFDTINSILDLGIPESAMATGGTYFHTDGREVPDVFQAAFEYPKRGFTLLYSGTLASGIPRGTLIMGRDATLELGRILSVWVDKKSIKYKSRIKAGIIDPAAPFVNYMKDLDRVDAITSATSRYYADRGLDFTYTEGKQVSTTGLHLAEWLSCIRSSRTTSCNINRGFEVAITAHMATLSYREGRKIRWDPESETIV
ncbi:MAG: Gfo/Idh/MocA family oxidoreductase [Bacteroidota bacterium]|nr:Gfo/Idh/MocA family oxidoreductase [Bacteroidota bacterium]